MNSKNTKLLAARVSGWLDFKIRKIAKRDKVSLGMALADAIQFYSNSLDIPQEIMNGWIKEFRKIEDTNKERK